MAAQDGGADAVVIMQGGLVRGVERLQAALPIAPIGGVVCLRPLIVARQAGGCLKGGRLGRAAKADRQCHRRRCVKFGGQGDVAVSGSIVNLVESAMLMQNLPAIGGADEPHTACRKAG